MKRVALGICLLVPLVSPGEEGLIEHADQSIYAKDGLFLKVALVEDPRAFLAEWSRPSRLQTPEIRTRTSFHRGDIVFPAVMYSTNALTPEGRADITYNLLFRRPDGSIYERLQDLTVVDGPPPKGLGLCKAKAGLKIEGNDPFGEYTLKVTITDKIKDVTVEMLFLFSVTDPAAKPPVKSRPPQETSRIRSFSGDRP
ncbi:MAG: hypothetical protein WCQ16_06125 [Verrucomicrobiae bacterium]